jgi:hypothetical protein
MFHTKFVQSVFFMYFVHKIVIWNGLFRIGSSFTNHSCSVAVAVLTFDKLRFRLGFRLSIYTLKSTVKKKCKKSCRFKVAFLARNLLNEGNQIHNFIVCL